MRTIRRTAALLLVVGVQACTSYHLVADPATALQASPSPVKSARITCRSGGQVVLNSPWVDGDSLRGGAPAGHVHAVSLADASLVEVRTADDTKTFLLVLGSLVAVMGAVFVALVVAYGGS